MTPCLFCGGDRSERGHDARCDGRQGAVEARHAETEATWTPPPDAWKPPENWRATEPAATVTIRAPRETTVQAFYNAVETGVIETRRAQVWAALHVLGEATANEVFEYLKESKHLGLRYDSNTRARMTELRDLGVIRESGQRDCRVTGQTCITWVVVPSAEYVGVATVNRCQSCGQIISREIPVTRHE